MTIWAAEPRAVNFKLSEEAASSHDPKYDRKMGMLQLAVSLYDHFSFKTRQFGSTS
jgi:hypothetical protein